MRTFWTPAQDDMMRELYPCKPMRELKKIIGRSECSIYNRAHTLGINKSAEYLASGEACRLNGQEEKSKVHRFKKGQVPPNKGLKGVYYEGSVPTFFKKGHKPANLKPVGHIRETKDGFLEIKMGEGFRQFKLLQRVVWERCNGEIPSNHVVVFLDGNKKNLEITNLGVLSRGQNMKRNSVHNYPKEIALLIQLQGQINRQINKRTNQNEQH